MGTGWKKPVDWGLTQIFDGAIYNIRQQCLLGLLTLILQCSAEIRREWEQMDANGELLHQCHLQKLQELWGPKVLEAKGLDNKS